MKAFAYDSLDQFLAQCKLYDNPKTIKMITPWEQGNQFRIESVCFLNTHILSWTWTSIEKNAEDLYSIQVGLLFSAGFVKGKITETTRVGI